MVSKKIVILVTAVVVTITMLIGSNYIAYSAEKDEGAMIGGKGSSDGQMTQDYNQMMRDHNQMMQNYRQMMKDHSQMMQNCRQMMNKRGMMKKKNQAIDEQTVNEEGNVKHDHSKH